MGRVVCLRTIAHIRSRLSGQQALSQQDGLVSYGNFLTLSHNRLLHHYPAVRSYGHLLVGGIMRDIPTCIVPPMLLQESCSRRGEWLDRARYAANLLKEAESSLGSDYHSAPLHGELPRGMRRGDHPCGDDRHIPDTICPHQGILCQYHHGMSASRLP